MFSDTHFHFNHLVTDRALDGKQILEPLVDRDMFFGLDIGTRCDDLISRFDVVEQNIKKLPVQKQAKSRTSIYYSAGIWPDIEEIKDRFNAVKKLEQTIEQFNSSNSKKLVAIGECGLDHHWNPSGADGRCEDDFTKEIYNGERELFEMQIALAQKLNLPVVIHSRDAFEDTLNVIKNMNYHNGIIHCYSYGKDEAKKFLDLGWYIAFGGSTTYTKKAKMDQMIELLCYVPDDMILIETDAPYLAPVPFRGQINTPVLVEHCYNFVATARNTTAQQLSQQVDLNIKKLFF